MRFLADESCDAAIVRALLEAGHDVSSVRDTMRGATDREVLEAALQERRLLLTEDKDFGELVFAAGAPAIGVMLLRCPPAARGRLSRRVVDFVATWHAEYARSSPPSGTLTSTENRATNEKSTRIAAPYAYTHPSRDR